jgi:hypothetical protein
MSTTTVSASAFYVSGAPSVATINPGDYPVMLNPAILPVKILAFSGRPQDGNGDYRVLIGDNISYTLNVTDNIGTITNEQIQGVNIMFPLTNMGTHPLECSGDIRGPLNVPNALTNSVTLNNGNPLNTSLYVNGDNYLIEMISLCNSGSGGGSGSTSAKVTFSRKNNITLSTNVCNDVECLCVDTNGNSCRNTCNTVEAPILNIEGQSMLNGSDVSDMTFTIFDKHKYYENKNIIGDHLYRCQLSKVKCDELKKTQFITCCSWMVSVTKGIGKTLREKLLYLISKNLQPNNMGINEFLTNIILYGMTRYVLSRILYGDFNIDYLLEKYYKQFIKDLGRSRFCRFVVFFEDCNSPDGNFVGYEKFFLHDKKCNTK